jgi:hypothetical protein
MKIKISKLINSERNLVKTLFYIFFFQVVLITFAYFIFNNNSSYFTLKTIILLYLIFFTILISCKLTKNLYSYRYIYLSILIFFILFIYTRFVTFALIPNLISFPYPIKILSQDIDNFLLFILASLPFIFCASYFAESIQKNLISKINFRLTFLNFKPNLKSLIILFILSILIEFLFLFYLESNPFSNIEVDKMHYYKMLLRNLINVDIVVFLVLGLILISNFKNKFILYFLICFIYVMILTLHFSKAAMLRISLIVIFQFIFLNKANFSYKNIAIFFLIHLILSPPLFYVSSELRKANASITHTDFFKINNVIFSHKKNYDEVLINCSTIKFNGNYLEKKICNTPELHNITSLVSSIFNRLGVVDYPILIIKRIKSSQFQDIDNVFTFGSLVKRVINVAPGTIFENHKLKEERLIGYVIMGYDKTSLAEPINYNTEPTTLWGSAYMYGNFYFGLVIIFFLFLISFFCFYFLKKINNKNGKTMASLFLFMGIYGLLGSFGLDGHIIKLIIIAVQVCIFFLMLYVFNKFWSILAFKRLINLFTRLKNINIKN